MLARFNNELIDIIAQLTHLNDHGGAILEANTTHDLDIALAGLAHSINALTACVTGLRYRLEPPVTWPEA